MENVEVKIDEAHKAPLPVVIISVFLLLAGILALVSLFFGGISGIIFVSGFIGSLNTIFLIVVGIASLVISFRLRKMKKSGLYGALILIAISFLPMILMLNQISTPYLIKFIFTPQSIIKIAILIYLLSIRKKFINA